MHIRAVTLGASLVAFALGCSSSSSPSAPPFSGTPGQPIAAKVSENIFLIPVTINGKDMPQLIVDTGSPVVVVNPASVPMGGVAAGIGTVDSLMVGALTFARAAVIGVDLIKAPSSDLPISGVLGCTVLCALPVSFNYRDSQVTLGQAALPAGLAADASEGDFRLQGGGAAQIAGVSGQVQLPASRIIVTATIEGVDHPFLVDTGASSVFIRKSVFSSIITDGRKQLTTQVATVEGEATSSLFRLRSVRIVGAEVLGAPASHSETIDGLLDGVGQEIGQPIDGLIGGTFLREFFVTIDYPARRLTLRRYAAREHIVDEAQRVGIDISAGTGGVLVSKVFAGTDADTKGVKVGDILTAVDGQTTAMLGTSQLMKQISGVVGASHEIQFGCAGCTGYTGMRKLRIDDLIPVP